MLLARAGGWLFGRDLMGANFSSRDAAKKQRRDALRKSSIGWVATRLSTISRPALNTLSITVNSDMEVLDYGCTGCAGISRIRRSQASVARVVITLLLRVLLMIWAVFTT